MVVYRATPPDVASGVRVGELEYPGFAAAGAGVSGADPSLKVAFFALLHDQPLDTPIVAFARDEAGNQAKASFVDNVFPKPFRKSRIEIDDKFINRVVPEILEHSPELKLTAPAESSPEMLRGLPPGQRRAAPDERRPDRGARGEDLAAAAVARHVRPARQLPGGSELRRSPHLHLQGEGGRPADPPRLRPGGHRACAGRGREQRHRA